MSHNAKAIHTTTKTKTPFRKPKPPVTPSKPKLSKKQGWLLATLAIAAALFLSYQIPIYREKRVYREAEKQITQFVDEAAKLAPSTKEIRKYCSYSSEKYGKGSLGCTVGAEVHFEAMADDEINNTINKLNTIRNKLSWVHPQDNTWNETNGPKTEINSIAYDYASIGCAVAYKYKTDERRKIVQIADKKIIFVDVSCTGSALKEYY
jgi:uncharacterized protein HemX